MFSPVQQSMMTLQQAAQVSARRARALTAPDVAVPPSGRRRGQAGGRWAAHEAPGRPRCRRVPWPAAGGCFEGTVSQARAPAEPEVFAVACSLYADELKPYGRLLRKRLGERGCGLGLAPGDTGLAQLRSICEGSAQLYVQAAQGGEWSALLFGVEPRFVDVYSPEDIYPAELWVAATRYFGSLGEGDFELPGGRFSCAQCLASRRLDFLEGRSLGQICHIVQLAISQKKILGYSNGGTVPYAYSDSMLKDVAASQQSSCVSAEFVARREHPLATWEALRSYLREALSSAALAGDGGALALSQVKTVFRSQFHVDLSETALGHSKLSGLLQDTRLADICEVRLTDQGYFVVPKAILHDKQGNRLSGGSASTSCGVVTPDDAGERGSASITSSVCSRSPSRAWDECASMPSGWHALSPSALAVGGSLGSWLRGTFVHVNDSQRHAVRRTQSVPKDVGSCRDVWEASCHALSFRSQPVVECVKDSDSHPLLLPA